ncbi:unnamed protein product [Musa hybrid cultivar]
MPWLQLGCLEAREGGIADVLFGDSWMANELLPPYRDATQPVESRVRDLLSRMTLREKAAQMAQIERCVASPSALSGLPVGSVLSAGGSAPRERASPRDWADMIDRMQHWALASRLGIPILYASDAVHGHNNLYGATIFPHNVALGAIRDGDLARRIGEATALEVRATGIHWTFAPCVAVCRDPRWGRCYESYSEDTDIVRTMTSIVAGLQGSPPLGHPPGHPFLAGRKNVIACAKHFVGDGGTDKGKNEGNTICTFEELEATHMKPYLDCLAQGVSTIMASYTSWNGRPLHSNHYLITEILKGKLGFKGFVISDWEGIDRLCQPHGSNYRYCISASVNAGIDMIMVPHRYEKFLEDLVFLVESGRISMSRIDDAVERILRVKFVVGLFEYPFSDRSLFDVVGCKEHQILAREAVRRSLVLLKNGKDLKKPILPLDKNARRILVAGTHADDIGYQCGGWTITWHGSSGRITIGTTVLEAIREAAGNETEVVYEKCPSEATFSDREYSYAIVAIGEDAYAEFLGDRTELGIPFDGATMISLIAGKVPTVVIVISGRPLVFEPELLDKIDALVAAWLPGSEGGGIADVLFGDYDFEANECCERLAYYGMSTNLVNYMKDRLHQGNATAANNVTDWSGTCYVMPLLGAFIADAYAGRYWTIASFMIIYILGLTLLTLTASVKGLEPTCHSGVCDPTRAQTAVVFTSLYLIALATGGIKPCVSSFGADQFDETDESEKKRKSSFFNWFYFSINIGSLVAASVLVWIQTNVGWGWGFGIPAVAMAVAVVSFFLGTPLYRHQKPGGSPLTRIAQVMVASLRKSGVKLPANKSLLYEITREDSAIRGSRKMDHTDQLKFLDKAAVQTQEDKINGAVNPWRLCTVTQVEELKSIVRLLPIWASGIVFSTVYSQMGTMFVLQGNTLDRHMGPRFEIPSASLSIFDTISVIVWVPIYDRVVVPVARRFTGRERGFTHLTRMGVGLVISIFAMSSAGVLEVARLRVVARHKRYDGGYVPMSVFWQVPQYVIVGAAEVFTFIGQLEFFYDQAPDAMRSMCSALSLTTAALGNYLSSLLVTIVSRITTKNGKPGWISDDLDRGHLDYFFGLLAVLSLVNFGVYLVMAKWYTYKKAIDNETKAEARNDM